MAAMTTAEVIFKVSLSEIIHLTSRKLPAKFDAFIRSVTIISLSHPTIRGAQEGTKVLQGVSGSLEAVRGQHADVRGLQEDIRGHRKVSGPSRVSGAR